MNLVEIQASCVTLNNLKVIARRKSQVCNILSLPRSYALGLKFSAFHYRAVPIYFLSLIHVYLKRVVQLENSDKIQLIQRFTCRGIKMLQRFKFGLLSKLNVPTQQATDLHCLFQYFFA